MRYVERDRHKIAVRISILVRRTGLVSGFDGQVKFSVDFATVSIRTIGKAEETESWCLTRAQRIGRVIRTGATPGVNPTGKLIHISFHGNGLWLISG